MFKKNAAIVYERFRHVSHLNSLEAIISQIERSMFEYVLLFVLYYIELLGCSGFYSYSAKSPTAVGKKE